MVGPVKFAAATPVMTKMPVPTTAPMPKRTSSNGFKTLFKACSPSVLSTSCRMDFVPKIRRGVGPGGLSIGGSMPVRPVKGCGRRWRGSGSHDMRFDRTSVGPCPAPLSVGEAAVQVSSAPAFRSVGNPAGISPLHLNPQSGGVAARGRRFRWAPSIRRLPIRQPD